MKKKVIFNVMNGFKGVPVYLYYNTKSDETLHVCTLYYLVAITIFQCYVNQLYHE